ncbi:hypothetical protein J6590_001524 [Homalodisca vitripennis]|nr:hypothetical protein J6590_001524 [Homalodisca vitripennis]
MTKKLQSSEPSQKSYSYFLVHLRLCDKSHKVHKVSLRFNSTVQKYSGTGVEFLQRVLSITAIFSTEKIYFLTEQIYSPSAACGTLCHPRVTGLVAVQVPLNRSTVPIVSTLEKVGTLPVSQSYPDRLSMSDC